MRTEPPDSYELVRRVVNRRRRRVADSLPGELAGKLAAEQFLKLVGFDAEHIWPKAAANCDALCDQLRRGPAGHVGFDVHNSLAIDGKQHVCRVVAATRIAAFAGIERDRANCN